MCRLRTSCGPRAGLVRTPWFPAVVPHTCSTDHHYFQRKLGGETSVLRTFIFACSFSKLPPPACPGTACNQFCPWMGHQQDSNTWLRLLDWNVRSHWLWQLDTSQQSFQTVHFRHLHECCVYMVIHSKNMFKLMFKTYDFHYGATCVYMVFTCSQSVFKTGFVQKSSEFHWGDKLVWLFGHVGVRSSMRENIPVPKLVQLPRVPVLSKSQFQHLQWPSGRCHSGTRRFRAAIRHPWSSMWAIWVICRRPVASRFPFIFQQPGMHHSRLFFWHKHGQRIFSLGHLYRSRSRAHLTYAL